MRAHHFMGKLRPGQLCLGLCGDKCKTHTQASLGPRPSCPLYHDLSSPGDSWKLRSICQNCHDKYNIFRVLFLFLFLEEIWSVDSGQDPYCPPSTCGMSCVLSLSGGTQDALPLLPAPSSWVRVASLCGREMDSKRLDSRGVPGAPEASLS